MVEYRDPPAKYAPIDAALAALADPTRRALLEQLRGGPSRISDLAAPLPMSLNAVSKHIKVLERAGLVARERVGREHRLRARPEGLAPAAAWIADMQAFWAERLDALEMALGEEEQKRRRSDERDG